MTPRAGCYGLAVMSTRSVVKAGAPRCARCRFAPRWCICAAERSIDGAPAIDVLFHHREWHRPTSTGRLITRLMAGARSHVFYPDQPPEPAAICRPGRELWILHPFGRPLGELPCSPSPQLLLLDGSWREATGMLRCVEGWGRTVSLPMTGPSRYRLRGQQGTGLYSTVETLLFLFAVLGQQDAHDALRDQFELHVYAGLRARGEKAAAEEFLATSPARDAFPELIAELNRRRPRE